MAEWFRKQAGNRDKKTRAEEFAGGRAEKLGAKKQTEDNKSVKTAEKEQNEGLTRRAFLAKSLNTLMQAGLATLLPKKLLAGLKDVLESGEKIEKKSLKEIIDELFFLANHEKKEQDGIFFRSRGMTADAPEYGAYFPSGSLADEDSVFTMPLSAKAILENSEDLEEIVFLHTHPIFKLRPNLYSEIITNEYVAEEDREKVGKMSILSKPPSIGDVFVLFSLVSSYPRAQRKVKEIVVDPSGYWVMKFDLENEKIKEILEYLESKKNLFKELDPIFRKYLKDKFRHGKEKEYGVSIEERFITDELLEWGLGLGDSAINEMTSIGFFLEKKGIEIFFGGLLDERERNLIIERFIKQAKSKGIILEYTPLKFADKK